MEVVPDILALHGKRLETISFLKTESKELHYNLKRAYIITLMEGGGFLLSQPLNFYAKVKL